MLFGLTIKCKFSGLSRHCLTSLDAYYKYVRSIYTCNSLSFILIHQKIRMTNDKCAFCWLLVQFHLSSLINSEKLIEIGVETPINHYRVLTLLKRHDCHVSDVGKGCMICTSDWLLLPVRDSPNLTRKIKNEIQVEKRIKGADWLTDWALIHPFACVAPLFLWRRDTKK